MKRIIGALAFIMATMFLMPAAMGEEMYYARKSSPGIAINISLLDIPGESASEEIIKFGLVLDENGYCPEEAPRCCGDPGVCSDPVRMLSVSVSGLGKGISVLMMMLDERCCMSDIGFRGGEARLLLFSDSGKGVRVFREIVSGF